MIAYVLSVLALALNATEVSECLHNCTGRGVCTDGVCQCSVDKNGFGWKGDDCSIPCGSHTFSGQGNERNCLYVPGGGAWQFLAADDQEMDCFCRKTTGFTDTRMRKVDWAKHHQTYASDHTIRCTNGAQFCQMKPFHDCDEVFWVRCQFGDDPSCA